MMPFALAGIFIGAILGTRCTVLALIPAMTCALIIAGVSSVTAGGALGLTVIELAWLLACLQIGYLGGAALRFSFYGNNRRGQMGRSSLERPLPRVHSR